jgi:hypothetical protein
MVRTMQVPTVIITVPLYDYDEDDNMVPFTDEQVNEVFSYMQKKDDFCGYAINEMFVEYYDWEDEEDG